MRVGEYTLLEALEGHGRDVHHARDDAGNRAVIAMFEMTAEGAASLREDARRCASLDHPGVARPLDVFEHEGQLVVAFEGIRGATLSEVLAYLQERNEHLSDGAALKIAAAVAETLDIAHTAKDDDGRVAPLVHAQLGPHQVFLTFDGSVRLLGLCSGAR